jgi:hypothetical protein
MEQSVGYAASMNNLGKFIVAEIGKIFMCHIVINEGNLTPDACKCQEKRFV